MSVPKLIVGITGATGSHAARLLVEKAPWPTALVVSPHGREVYERECGPFAELTKSATAVYDNADLAAPPSSGSVDSIGMVILPCTVNTLARIASGLADSLITRAAHCHLKERRPLVLCVRESPWTAIDFENARRVTEAGGIVMPLSPPYYMFAGKPADAITLDDLLQSYVDRVLALLGRQAERTWEDVR